jgi:hypothetical protein
MTIIGVLDYDQNDSCVNPKWLLVKEVAQKGCRDRLDLRLRKLSSAIIIL